jgi:acyl-CoA thioesterase-2
LTRKGFFWLAGRSNTSQRGRARDLARGQLYTQDGQLVVSVVQEGLIRVAKA